MGRILICECKQEILSSNPVLGRYKDFIVTRGTEILAYHRQVRSEMGRALSVFDSAPGVELVPGYRARRFKGEPEEPGTHTMPAADFPVGRPCGMDARSAHF